jgi:hypothetical protein
VSAVDAHEAICALAEELGACAAAQCSDGEEWAPEDFLAADWRELQRAADQHGVALRALTLRDVWMRYAHPSPEAVSRAREVRS